MNTVGSRIRWARDRVGDALGRKYGQGRLAQDCGWGKNNRSRVANYETGVSTPDLDDIVLMARHLNVSPAWIAFGEIPGARLTPDERAVLIAYRLAPPKKRAAVLELLGGPHQPDPNKLHGPGSADPRNIRSIHSRKKR